MSSTSRTTGPGRRSTRAYRRSSRVEGNRVQGPLRQVELAGRRLRRADLLLDEEPLAGVAAAWKHRRLSNRVRELAAEEVECDLAGVVDCLEKGLHHDRLSGRVQAADVIPSPLVAGVVPSGFDRAGSDGGLDDERRVRGDEVLLRLEKGRRDRLHPERCQVPLVRVPAQHRGRVEDPRQGFRPREELVTPLRVVPRRPDDDEVEVRPVDAVVVPDRWRSIDAARPEGIDSGGASSSPAGISAQVASATRRALRTSIRRSPGRALRRARSGRPDAGP